MEKRFLFTSSILLALIMSSCTTTNGFQNFYKPWLVADIFTSNAYLAEGENPQIIHATDLDEKYREISSNWYICIGNSRFNGPDQSDETTNKDLTKLCIDKKAKIAIWAKEYTDTRNGVYSRPHTNYNYYTNSYGYTSSYTTTSYSTSSYSIQRYDFSSYLFVSIPENERHFYAPGIFICDLTQKDRDLYKRNTGCLIDFVYKNTNAYFANLSHGDIIININGYPILSADDFRTFRNNSKTDDLWIMTIVRDGVEKTIELRYNLH